jgi:hypothetical protein
MYAQHNLSGSFTLLDFKFMDTNYWRSLTNDMKQMELTNKNYQSRCFLRYEMIQHKNHCLIILKLYDVWEK